MHGQLRERRSKVRSFNHTISKLPTEQIYNEVQVGKDQEKAQSERDSHSKNRGGKKKTNNQALIPCNIS